MKKYIFTVFTIALLCSCSKEKKCWIVIDCLGNDVTGYCNSEKKVQEYCQAHSSPTCTWGYRPE